MRSPLILAASCFLLSVLTSCSSEPRSPEEYNSIETAVYYGTDRNRREDGTPNKFYGETRGELEYGIARIGGVGEDLKTRVEVVDPMPREQFLQELKSALEAAPEPTALVFVHGFLRSFRQVSRQVAEFADDTNFKGVPIVWSWPSTNNPALYTVDETNINWAQRDFAYFLEGVLTKSGAKTVHLVGHSMGGRGLVNVTLQNLLPAGLDLTRLGQFVLLAPDIDQEIFRRDMAPALVDAGVRVTLYTSANDNALLTAHRVHGYSRAGDSSEGALVVDGIETVDVTLANRSILGHSYFEESEAVAEDLANLLNQGLSASRRQGLEPAENGGKRYWRLVAGQ